MNSIKWNHIYNANTIELQFDCFINNIINIPIESIQIDLHKTDRKRSWNIIKNIINKEDNRRSAKDIVFLINNKYISD